MDSLYNKEKKLETVLKKLKSLSGSPSIYEGELEQLYFEKNQLQSESALLSALISSYLFIFCVNFEFY